jgi:hypothetical protein
MFRTLRSGNAYRKLRSAEGQKGRGDSSDRFVPRHRAIRREILTLVAAQWTATGLRLIPFRLHSFAFVGFFAIRAAEMAMVVRCSVFADKLPSTAFTSTDSWH